jgi:hypothetical protein
MNRRRENMSHRGLDPILEVTMSAESSRRAPWVVLFFIGTMVSFPFLLLAFAVSPLGGSWLRFVIPALPFIALLLAWLWVRAPADPQAAMDALAQEAYPPGA